MELNPQQKKAAEYEGPGDHLLVLPGYHEDDPEDIRH